MIEKSVWIHGETVYMVGNHYWTDYRDAVKDEKDRTERFNTRQDEIRIAEADSAREERTDEDHSRQRTLFDKA
jgi:hypothetical protein